MAKRTYTIERQVAGAWERTETFVTFVPAGNNSWYGVPAKLVARVERVLAADAAAEAVRGVWKTKTIISVNRDGTTFRLDDLGSRGLGPVAEPVGNCLVCDAVIFDSGASNPVCPNGCVAEGRD